MTLCQSLQGCQRRRDNQEVGINVLPVSRHIINNKIANTSTIEFTDIVMTIVARRFQGKK